MLSSRECISWTTIYSIEHVAIVTSNAIAIIAFMKNRKLLKRSTYLILNLAIIDMLLGFTGPWTVYEFGMYCGLWKGPIEWWEKYPFPPVIRLTVAISSLINITVISLERLHATVRPFAHRFVKNWVGLQGNHRTISYLIAVLFSVISVSNPLSYSLEMRRSYNTISAFASVCIIITHFSYSLHPHESQVQRSAVVIMLRLLGRND